MRAMVFDRYGDSRNIERARIAAAAQVALIVFGWGVAQSPYLVRPGLTIVDSAGPSNNVSDLVIAAAMGALVLIPSLILLLLVFKTHRESISVDADATPA
jgi:cytochrome d ubiquinol oxidase subunit II